MKLIDLTCSKCGATLQVNPELTKCMCQYCGNEILIDNEVQHHSLDNGFEFGYQAEMGRQQAQQEMQRQAIIQQQKIDNEQYIKRLQIEEEHKQRTFHIWTIVLLIIYPFIGIPMMFFDKKYPKDKRKIPFIIWGILLIYNIIVALISSSNYKTDRETIIHPPYASSEAKGKQYTEVIQAYQNAGFTNVSFEKIDDLVFGWLTKDGEVEKVEINGSTEYTTEESYNQSEAHVVIYFHTFPHKEDADETEIIEEDTETNEDADETSDTVEEIRDNDTIDEQQNNTASIDENGYYHLSKEQIGEEYLNRKICIYGKITDELYGDKYSYPYIEVNGINCYVENMDFNEFMSANDISWTNDEDVYATVYGTLDSYGLFGGLINNIDCIVLDNGNYYGDISLYNKDEASKIINVTAEELLKLSENQNYVSINGATEEIYNTYNNKKCTVTGTVRDIQGNSIFIDSDDNGYNYVNADTTTVVYYVTDDVSKYSIGDYVEVTGTLKCYRYAIQIIEK